MGAPAKRTLSTKSMLLVTWLISRSAGYLTEVYEVDLGEVTLRPVERVPDFYGQTKIAVEQVLYSVLVEALRACKFTYRSSGHGS